MTQILMPKATAVWLIDNTGMTFKQISEFCSLHILEVEGIADGEKGKKKGPRYTPLSRRQDRPDAIAWIVRNHPEVPDSQISKLIGTTKPTINAIRERTHWKINTINPTDPVSLGL